jgi:putative hemolysin
MPLSARLDSFFEAESRRARSKHRLQVSLANTLEDVRAAQRLRYQVFVEEMGARLSIPEAGIESDRYDHFCQHLLVRDHGSGQVVGCYRLLTDSQAARAGGFYSQTEFDLDRILRIPGRRVEVGRTCVHPEYRNGAVISLLWSGLARFMLMHRYDFLMGCASIPMSIGREQLGAIWHQVASQHLAPSEWRVFPHRTCGALPEPGADTAAEMPPLIRAYFRLGAQVCGEPAWDPSFDVADLFLLLSLDRLGSRYAQHFIRRG